MRRDEEQALRALRSLGHSLAGSLARARRWRARASEVGVRVMDELVSRLAGHPVRTRPKDLLRRAAQLGAGVLETTLFGVDERPASTGPAAPGPEPLPAEPAGREALLGTDGARVRAAPSHATAARAAHQSQQDGPEGGVRDGPGHDEAELLLLSRDPEWAYVSWRFPYDLIGRRAAGLRGAEARLRVRHGSTTVIDESVTPARGRYFFPWPRTDGSFRAELVIRGAGGREVELGHSRPVRPGGIAPSNPSPSHPSGASARAPAVAARWLAQAEAASSPRSSSPSSVREGRSSFVPSARSAAERPEHPGASWSPASGAGASWSPASGAGASWSPASGAGASWSPASGAGASWSPASGAGASWSPASGAGASWSPASGAGASWSPASGAGASWGRASSLGAGPNGVRPWPFDPERLARLVEPSSQYQGPAPGAVSAKALGFGLGRPQGPLIPALHDPLHQE